MQTAGPTTEPTGPDEQPDAHPRSWGRRLLMLLVGLLAVGATAFLVALMIRLASSSDDAPRPTFAADVTILGTRGRFEARTTNLGRRAKAPTCTVTAFDIYGHRVGSEAYELEKTLAGETVEWGGRVAATATVERMSIGCD